MTERNPKRFRRALNGRELLNIALSQWRSPTLQIPATPAILPRTIDLNGHKAL